MERELPKRAYLSAPPWLWGGNPEGFFARSRLRWKADRDGSFWVQTEESFQRQRPRLFQVKTILAPGMPGGDWQALGRMKERLVGYSPPIDLAPLLEERRQRVEDRQQLLDVFNHQRMLLYALEPQDLPVQAKHFVDFLTEQVSFAEIRGDSPFRNVCVHVVEADQALSQRLRIASIWLRIEQDPKLAAGDARSIAELNRAREAIFAASAGLYDGTMLFDGYLAPLIASGSPGVWALQVVRTFGSMLFSFGTFISGTAGDPAELLQLISVPGADALVPFAPLSPSASDAAVRWWVDRLNEMFAVLSDLATFVDADGQYQPGKQLESLLTIEQVFRRTTSSLLAHRDKNARRSLLFTLLDSLEGLRGANLLTMCRLSHATKVLARLEAAMPVDAAEILLPAARRAVDALTAIQDGFYLHRQLRTDAVELHLGEGKVQSWGPEEAAARYLKVLRDATHGHGSTKDSSKAITSALLAHHNGDVPHDIGLLGYLYLLDVLMHPDRLRLLLKRSGGT